MVRFVGFAAGYICARPPGVVHGFRFRGLGLGCRGQDGFRV